MAKIRRIIRKLKPTVSQAFDDQLWPVILALCVLGGFIMGSVIAYLRFDDARWYANAITWLIATVLLLGGVAVGLAFIDSRTFRRSMQLAIILCLFFHAILFVSSIELKIFERIFDVFVAQNDLTETRQPITVPEYFETPQRDQTTRDFERPVETETPQIEPLPEEIEREEAEPQEEPTEPQPTPVPEPERTVRPNIVRRQQPQETAPRHSEQQSRLSRRMTQTQPLPPSVAVTAPDTEPTVARPSQMQAADSSVARQETQAQTRRRTTQHEPTTVDQHQTTQIARRETEQSPRAQSAAAPTARRQTDTAIAVPRTRVELSETPAISQRTNPNELRPQTTLAQRQTTSTPDRSRSNVEPMPDTATSAPDQRQRRELRTEDRPTTARTPVSVPNRRARATPRPDLATAATNVTSTTTPRPPQQEPTLVEATTSPVRRTTTERQIERRTIADEPPTASQQNAARIARRQTRQTPVDESNLANTQTPRRQTARPTVAANTAAQVTRPAAIANDSQASQLRPTATAAARQATANDQVARAVAEPSADAPTAAAAPTAARNATRPPRAEVAPNIAQTARSLPNRRPQPALHPNITTEAAEATPAPAPQPNQIAAAPQARSGTVGRRQTGIEIQPSASAAEPVAESQQAASARLTRRQSTQTPESADTAPSLAVNTPRRQIARSAVAPSTTAHMAGPTTAAATGQAAGGEPAAQPTPASRVATTGAAPARTGGGDEADGFDEFLIPNDGNAAEGAAGAQIARRQAASTVAAAQSAPASTPRRQASTPSIGPSTAAEAAQAPSVAAAADSAAGQVAASPTSTERQATANTLVARAGAQPAVASASPEGGASGRAPTRRPRGADSPSVAQTPISSLARRESATTAPGATTVSADVAANQAPTGAASDQPRPSSATVARQATSNPNATRSQQSLNVQAASPTTQIAQAAAQRAQSTGLPSINPAESPSPRPARTAMRSAISASPTNVESPAVAQATQGMGNPSAAPARTALSRGVTGIAGVGQGRNLDRAKPAADSPAMIASASARRAESVQDTPPGPALSPAAPALVRRSRAGADMPGASLQAEPVAEIATAAGAQQPSELVANASAVLTRADAGATQGPITAARGVTDVDLGPTRVVSEGGTSRASGGGQPAMNFETDSNRIARNADIGGAPLAAIAATTVVDAPTAPPSDAGGQPATPQTNMEATAVARADSGGSEPISGGPAKATEVGPPTEVSMAEQVAEAAVSRAELAEALPGEAKSGGGDPDDEDEEERQRRLARTATRTALLPTPATADTADVAVAPGSTDAEAAAAATAVARATNEATGGGPAGGPQQSGPAGEMSNEVASHAARRAQVAEDTPEGPAIASLPSSRIGRSTGRSPSPPTTLRAESIDVAPAGGATQAAEMVASANTAVTRSALGSAGTPTAGATGSVEIEGGVQQPAPNGGPARAQSGAGPAVSLDTESPQLARAVRAGSAPITTAGAAADAPTAAEGGISGDRPSADDMAPEATAVARADIGGSGPVTGGPADADTTGQSDTAEQPAPAAITRARASEGAPGEMASGGGQPDVDPSAAVARKIARRMGTGTPELALAGPNPTAIAAAPASDLAAGGGASGGPIVGPVANPEATTTARTTGGGTPAGGQPSSIVEAGPAGGASGGDLLAVAQYTRAETVEGVLGSPEVGGGTGSPTRTAAGPTLAANTQAETVELVGSPDSGGMADGSLVAAQGAEPVRLPGGVNSPPAHGPVGTLAGDTRVDVAGSESPGLAIGTRNSSPSADRGPDVGQTDNLGARLDRSSLTSLPTGTAIAAAVDVPGSGSFGPVAQATNDHSAGDATGAVELARQSTEGGLAVNIDAPTGPGGIGAEYTLDSGLNNRRARNESMQVQVRTARFVRQHVGGLPDVSTAAVVAAKPFRRRGNRNAGGDAGDGHGGTPPPQTEETVELGLSWLARQQLPDGSWSLQGINGEKAALVTDTAATGLALLAFQGAGYSHREHKYVDVVNGGVRYLLANQKEDGDLFIPMDDESNRSVRFYSHSIALLALCESYGMTQDPELREPIQKAIDFLLEAQHPERGGWRYSAQYGSDMSVTGWAMMALKSGQLANLDVPEKCFTGIRRWLDKCQGSGSEPHLYRYNPYAPNTEEQRHGRTPNKTMTSVGLLLRLYLDWRRDNEHMINGAKHLSENLPAIGSSRNPQRDTYYWYYATQVMFHMGGDYWKAWNGRLHPLLVNTQIKRGSMAGSWDPRNPVPDRWAPHAGRLYVTTINLLSLEVYYRHLPLYEDYAK